MPRPIVFTLTAHYLPGYKAGGPIRTIRNLVGGLAEEFDFRILTSDHDFGRPERYRGVTINGWNDVKGAKVLYADASGRSPSRLAALIREANPDVVYVNSFFGLRFSILPLLLRRLGRTDPRIPWIVAPRGEFSREALAIKAPKKRAFMAAARMLSLHRGVLWQASNTHEADDIVRALGVPREAIHVARNLDQAGVGWVRPLDDRRPFVEAIEGYAALGPNARVAMRRRAHAYAARVAASSEARDANRRLFTRAQEQAARAG